LHFGPYRRGFRECEPSGERIRSIAGFTFAAFPPVFSPDGCTINTASSRDARVVHLVDAESGALLLEMLGDPPHPPSALNPP